MRWKDTTKPNERFKKEQQKLQRKLESSIDAKLIEKTKDLVRIGLQTTL